MKNWLRTLIPGLLLISVLGSPVWAQGRMATVDLRKIFDNYWKKKQAEAALKERQGEMEKEDKNMLEDYKKVKEEYQSLLNNANDPAISSDERDKRKKAAEDKLKRMKELEETISAYERQARTTLTEQGVRMRANLLSEIRNVVSAKAKSGGFGMVIDIAAETANNTPFVLFTNNENDITDEVLAQLNAAAPPEAAKPDEKTGEKKNSAKKDGKN